MHSKTKGGIGVAKVAEYLLLHEIPVFGELFCDNSEIDLIADTAHGLKTIQIKTRNSINGSVTLPLVSVTPGTRKTPCRTRRASNKVDIFALYVRNENKLMFVDANDLSECKRSLCFRTTQVSGKFNGFPIRFVDDYSTPSFLLSSEAIKKPIIFKEKFPPLVEIQCSKCNNIFLPTRRGHKWCHQCRSEMKRAFIRPTKEELHQMIDTMSWVAIGRKYGVTDNAVKKWAKRYGLPTKKRYIRSNDIAF